MNATEAPGDAVSTAPYGRRWIPAKQFFRENGIGTTLGYELIRRGEIESRRPGGRKLLVPSDALDRMPRQLGN